jgi:hypothetical protein
MGKILSDLPAMLQSAFTANNAPQALSVVPIPQGKKSPPPEQGEATPPRSPPNPCHPHRFQRPPEVVRRTAEKSLSESGTSRLPYCHPTQSAAKPLPGWRFGTTTASAEFRATARRTKWVFAAAGNRDIPTWADDRLADHWRMQMQIHVRGCTTIWKDVAIGIYHSILPRRCPVMTQSLLQRYTSTYTATSGIPGLRTGRVLCRHRHSRGDVSQIVYPVPISGTDAYAYAYADAERRRRRLLR